MLEERTHGDLVGKSKFSSEKEKKTADFRGEKTQFQCGASLISEGETQFQCGASLISEGETQVQRSKVQIQSSD